MGAVCISFEFSKSIALLPFFKFLGKWWNKLYKKYTVFISLVLVDNATTDWPRSVALWFGVWCCFGVVVLSWCCSVALLSILFVRRGDRSKNSLIALKDRSPNSRKKRGQTKSTKNNQFSKITQRMCCFPCRVSVWFYLIF